MARYLKVLAQLGEFSRSVKQEKVDTARGNCSKPVGLVLVISAEFGETGFQWKKLRCTNVVYATAPLDSFLSPLATAIFYGNVVVAVVRREPDRRDRFTRPSADFSAQLPPNHPALDAVLAPLLLTLDRSAVSCVPYSTEAVQILISHGPNAVFATTRSATLRDTIASTPVGAFLIPRAFGLNAVVVDKSASARSMGQIAKAVARGKFVGLGGGVGSVDYVLVHEELHGEFVAAVKTATVEMYGSDPSISRDYGRIVDHDRHDALVRLLRKEFDTGTGRVVHGGPSAVNGFLPPTIVDGPERCVFLALFPFRSNYPLSLGILSSCRRRPRRGLFFWYCRSRAGKTLLASFYDGKCLHCIFIETHLTPSIDNRPGDYTYVFADRKAVTYLSRELSSTIFVDQVPIDPLGDKIFRVGRESSIDRT